MDYTVRGILQARILEWVALTFSRGIFPTQGSNPDLPYCRRILYQLSYEGSPLGLKGGINVTGSSQDRWMQVKHLALCCTRCSTERLHHGRKGGPCPIFPGPPHARAPPVNAPRECPDPACQAQFCRTLGLLQTLRGSHTNHQRGQQGTQFPLSCCLVGVEA